LLPVVFEYPSVPVSFDQFCADCETSGLLTADEVAAARAGLGESTDPQQLARALVKGEKLTAFQAQQVYAGKGKALVLGNYVLLDKLGQGGMGAVYKASHRRMKRIVALKVLSPDLTKTEEAVSRFLREVEATGRLQHPHIVNAFDADCVGKTHFLVMEYVEGSDLSSLVKAKGPLAVDKAVHCVVQAAKGLEYAHSQGIVHRDIKPANLLLDKAGVVKILDMGLARFSDAKGAAELTQSGAVMGTVDYMPPEQALSSKSADHRSDIYSLGITLWYLLTGRAAYDGDSLMAKLLAHSQQPIPSLKAACAAVPASLDAVFQRMVAKKPEDRFPSMTDALAALEQALLPGASAPSLMSVRSEASRLDEAFGELDRAVTEQRVAATGTIVLPPNQGTAAPKPTPATARKSSPGNPKRPVPLRSPLSVSTLPPHLRYGAIGGAVLAVLALLWWGVRPGSPRPPAVADTTAGKPSPAAPKTDPSPEKPPTPLKWPFNESTAISRQAAWAKHLGQNVVEKNSLGMEMVLIPPGSFKMGSPPTEVGREKHEDQVSVTLTKPFRMARTEVTIAQYRAFADETGYVTAAESGGGGFGRSATEDGQTSRPGISFRKPAYPLADDHPAMYLNSTDAQKFCEWLGQREGRVYRLPTEAEWEWTCRAGTVERFQCGNHVNDLVRVGNVGDASMRKRFPGWNEVQGDDGFTYTAPVGRFAANPFGVHDLVGNLSEWCADGYADHLPGGIDPLVEELSHNQRTARGGFWFSDPQDNRSAKRWARDAGSLADFIGFRPVEVLPASLQQKNSSVTHPEPPPAPTSPAPLQWPFNEAAAKNGQSTWAKHLGQEVVQKNSLGMDLVLIPPGEFRMGAIDSEQKGAPSKVTGRVRITRPFLLASREVTRRDFSEFTRQSAYRTEAERGVVSGHGVEGENFTQTPAYSWKNTGFTQSDDHPVVNVTWNDAVAFCDWLSKKENRTYRLPTEAEWEYACRAGTTTRFQHGDDPEGLVTLGNVPDALATERFPNFIGIKGRDGFVFSAPVGSYRTNAFGLYDMHGNVWEWCSDWAGAEYRSTIALDDPTGPTTGVARMVRGGSWYNSLDGCESGFRVGFPAEFATFNFGFRIALSVTATSQPSPAPAPPPSTLPASSAPTSLQSPFNEAAAKAAQLAWANILSQPIIQKNGLGMDLVLIPPGSFTMGSPASEPERDAAETQTPATIAQPFRFGRTEVTVGQYRAFVADSGYKTAAERDGKGALGVEADGRWRQKPEYNWSNTGFTQGDDHPVVNVNWYDAVAFCEWLSKKESQPYRLPLEVEWEWACRAGTATPWHHGDDPTKLDKVANLRDATLKEKDPALTGFAGRDPFPYTGPVGSFPPNPFGFVDMHGNVAEWTLAPGDIELLTANTPLSTLPASSGIRIKCGGGWYEQPKNCRAARRFPIDRQQARLNGGFRIVLGFSGARVEPVPPPAP
jgi:formylglycine-generating enzyme required for sulfatase activity/tRNA A-37 threonylcarbamoyl transferase component Bud32